MRVNRPGPSRRSTIKGALAFSGAVVLSGCMGEKKSRPRRVLWSAGLRTKPVSERLDVAAEYGFSHISIFPIDFQGLLDSGQSRRQIKKMIRDSGVGVAACDPYTQWVPDWQMPEGYPEDYVAFVNFGEDFILSMAETLEADAINCVEPFGVEYETAALTDYFGGFAERARSAGFGTVHEFMPISGIPDLQTAWAFLSDLPAELGRLTFDTWHFYRSDPDFELLKEIPGDRFGEIQLADALNEIHGGDLTTDLLAYRRQPGDGEFDLDRVLQVLDAKGVPLSIGPEVFSNTLDAQSADQVARDSRAAMSRFNLMAE